MQPYALLLSLSHAHRTVAAYKPLKRCQVHVAMPSFLESQRSPENIAADLSVCVCVRIIFYSLILTWFLHSAITVKKLAGGGINKMIERSVDRK